MQIQGIFFNWASPLDWPPPKFSKCWNHIHFARHLDVFRSKGGPVWDSDVFLKSVTNRPTLSKFRGAPVKKNTLYVVIRINIQHFRKLKSGSKLLRNRSANLPPFCGIKRFFEILGGLGMKGHLGVGSKSKSVSDVVC